MPPTYSPLTELSDDNSEYTFKSVSCVFGAVLLELTDDVIGQSGSDCGN